LEPGYRFTTNGGEGQYSASLPLDMVGDTPDEGVVARNISFELQPGSNVFEFDRDAYPRSAYGLSLFFASSATPFAVPVTGDDAAVFAGDLAVASVAGTSVFFVPEVGTMIGPYGSGAPPVAYSGATTFAIGTDTVRVSEFNIANIDGGPTGSFTLELSTVPEPSTFLIWTVGLIGLLVWGRRRRR